MENVAIQINKPKTSDLKDVVFLESIGGFTRKYCNNGREFLVENDLHKIEETLPTDKFIKINDSFIINADYLKRIRINVIKNVIMQGDVELNIAQDKYWDLIRFLKFKYNIW